jgi:drug/metabolite transporter (DMT)-like permease
MPAVVRRHRHALLLTGAAACWGVATVISKRAVAEIPPLTLLPVQLAVSVATLLVLTRLRRVRMRWSPDLHRLGALGVLNPGASYALGLAGLAHITASLSVVLWAVEPLLILALAWWLLRERITRPLVATVAAAFTGVLLIVVRPGSGGQALGVVLTLAGVAACALYTIIARTWLADDSTLAVVMTQQAYALAFAVALGTVGLVVSDTTTPLSRVSGEAWLSAIASGVLYYAIAFWLYLSGLKRVPAAVAGLFINLVPIFGIAAGHLFLAERLTGRQWLGAAVVVVAVSVAMLSPWWRPPAARPAGERPGGRADWA